MPLARIASAAAAAASFPATATNHVAPLRSKAPPSVAAVSKLIVYR